LKAILFNIVCSIKYGRLISYGKHKPTQVGKKNENKKVFPVDELKSDVKRSHSQIRD